MRRGVPDLRFRPVEPPFGYVSLQTSVGRARRAAVLVHDPHHPTARSAGGEPPHGGSAREGVATSAIGSDPRPWPPHSQVPHAVMARRPIMLAHIGSSQIKRTRWFAAQEYEQAFWQGRATSIQDGTAGQLDWYDWKACRLEEHLASVAIPSSNASRVLEIGSGPTGIVNALKWRAPSPVVPILRFVHLDSWPLFLGNPGLALLARA